jgi:hypothetical protein
VKKVEGKKGTGYSKGRGRTEGDNIQHQPFSIPLVANSAAHTFDLHSGLLHVLPASNPLPFTVDEFELMSSLLELLSASETGTECQEEEADSVTFCDCVDVR